MKTVRRVKTCKGSNPLSSFSGPRPLSWLLALQRQYRHDTLERKLTVFPYYYRGVEQLAARRAHNPEVTGSSPVPAIAMIVAALAAYKHVTLERKLTVLPSKFYMHGSVV